MSRSETVKTENIQKRNWDEFRDAKLLWWVNRTLHLFGWAIVFEFGENGKICEVYPARIKFRGFDEQAEAEGFTGLTEYLSKNTGELHDDVKK